MKSLSLLLLLAVASFSSGIISSSGDTTLFWTFKADSMKYGKAFELTSSTYNALCVGANDTNSAGYVSDSIKFSFGIQFGTVVVNSSTKSDTSWSTLFKLGTFSTIPADTAGKWVAVGNQIIVDTTGAIASPSGVMDTSNVTGYAYTSAPFTQPFNCEIVRPWIQGVSGNRVGGWIKVRTQLKQLNYLPTRAQ